MPETYQKRLDEYFTSLKGSDLELLSELEQTKLKEEIARMHKDDRAILDATKEVGMEAWIQAYRKVTNACQFVFDTFKNRFSLTLDPRYVKSVKISFRGKRTRKEFVLFPSTLVFDGSTT